MERRSSSASRSRWFMWAQALLLLLPACAHYSTIPPAENASDPPEQTIGERLFLETRFAQFFAANSAGEVNAPLLAGDPSVQFTETLGALLPGPFAGASMNCGACHLVDQQDAIAGGGIRTYCDFARRSPIPDRADGKTLTARNSPPLVNSTLAHASPFLLHFDGEFTDGIGLVEGTLTGRNYGWLPTEHDQAVSHIASIIRMDDGKGTLAADYGALSYKKVLNPKPTDVIPDELLLPESFRIDVTTATDVEIVQAISKLIDAYVRSLVFIQDDNGEFDGSPYDLFLKKNHLPRKPDPQETDLHYSRRLRDLVSALTTPVFVSGADGSFTHHAHPFRFGLSELQGLKVFLGEPATTPPSAQELAAGGLGNCLVCHSGPRFTDASFHNVATAQQEYDSIHGAGSFEMLSVPDLTQRSASPDAYLPASVQHPNALGPFRSVPSLAHPELTDLGLWNVFANDDLPGSQNGLQQLLCTELQSTAPSCDPADLLAFTIARFKTPGLRDLSHAQPYMHTGQFNEIEDVLANYRHFSTLARQGMVRNAAPELSGVALVPTDVQAVADFLRSLDEDYE